MRTPMEIVGQIWAGPIRACKTQIVRPDLRRPPSRVVEGDIWAHKTQLSPSTHSFESLDCHSTGGGLHSVMNSTVVRGRHCAKPGLAS